MPKFQVNVTRTNSYIVEADDEDAAQEIADQHVGDSDDESMGEQVTNNYDTQVTVFPVNQADEEA